ncbi:matrix metalloproteinase-20-like [Macrosteles quadrilineatus]|uniref:matrix metalloproteinase-20-like n=1 Tax=Macrosteles quadrilineatus TaxID=74068 RepID=UPI0023E14F5E|nr:matrix metalloproteinase-20-like [Macrosteles quadrilineatus]
MFVCKTFIFTTLALISTGDAAPLDVTKHLAQFGYLPPIDPNKPNSIISNEALSSALSDYQQYMGLQVTGSLTDETKQQMIKPRCGIRDKAPPGGGNVNTFKLGGTRWSKKTLSYKITKYPRNFPRDETDRTIRKALDIWSAVTPLTFVRKDSGKVHFEIRFDVGSHGDDNPFDGPEGVLAHAYYPTSHTIGGDAHFDDTEQWTINSHSGTNLLQVATHEFGHALGLDHSKVKRALMYPTLQGYDPNFSLHPDDIKAIQTLYPSSFTG